MKQNAMLFLDLRRASDEYPVSRRKLQLLIKEGRLRAYRLDGKLFIKREDLERLLTATPVQVKLDQIVDEVMSELRDGK